MLPVHAALRESLQTQLKVRLDDDDEVEHILHLPLDEQRDVVYRHPPGRNRLHPGPCLGRDEGQKNLLQARAAQVVGEDQTPQGAAVERAIGGEDAVPEFGHDRRKTIASGADDIARDLVSTGHDCTACL